MTTLPDGLTQQWAKLPPEPVPWAELGWLGWPAAERRHWVAAPAALNFSEAEAWAKAYAERLGGRPKTLMLINGITLVRVR
ncbi:MAG TPA: hypothetical protein VGF07_13205 [Stellaceae bacterium]|jgi:hypothetical protein